MNFSPRGPKPSCQSCRKHNECCEVNWNCRQQEFRPDLEELRTKIVKRSANIGGVAAASHRKINQFGRVATAKKGKDGQNLNRVAAARDGKRHQVTVLQLQINGKIGKVLWCYSCVKREKGIILWCCSCSQMKNRQIFMVLQLCGMGKKLFLRCWSCR